MSASTIARDLLAKLLDAGNKHAAGARARAPALTATHLKPYSEAGNTNKYAMRPFWPRATLVPSLYSETN